MKRLKKAFIVLLTIIFVINLTIPCFAHERTEQSDDLFEIMFGKYRTKGEIANYEVFDLLVSAAYLAIDQFNNNGQNDLDKLKRYGIKGIPFEVKEISINASGRNHRNYTHRGWNFNYGPSSNWPARKNILLNTADCIFDFYGDTAKLDSFCAIIYYVHIIGDHFSDNSYIINNGLKIDIGGRTDKYDIVNELIRHLNILFTSQKHTYKFQYLIGELEYYNSKLKELMNSDGGINNDKKFNIKKDYTKKIIDLLKCNLPELLKNEKFFADVFYY